MEKLCKTCERYKGSLKQKFRCLSFTAYPTPGKDCWAYTTDKDWLQKVQQAVIQYRRRVEGEAGGEGAEDGEVCERGEA